MYQLALRPDGSTITQEGRLADGSAVILVRCTDEDGNSLYRPLEEFTRPREVGSNGDSASPPAEDPAPANPPVHNGEAEDDLGIVLHPPEAREPIPPAAAPPRANGLSMKQIVADWVVCFGLLFGIGRVIMPIGQAFYEAHHPGAASAVWCTAPILWAVGYFWYLKKRAKALKQGR